MTVNANTIAAILAITAAVFTGVRVLGKLRQVVDDLTECKRDRDILRRQLELVQRTLLGMIPARDRESLARRIQEIELADEDEGRAAA